MRYLAIALGLTLFNSAANAALIITVTGTPGSGETQWSFDGTEVVTDDPGTTTGNLRFDDDDGGVSWGWFGLGIDFYTGTDNSIQFTPSTSIVMAANGNTYEVKAVGAVVSSPTEGFGFAIDEVGGPGQGFYTFTLGTSLVFNGTATAPVDISEFRTGTTAAHDWRSTQGSNVFEDLPVTFNVNPVPEPATLAIWSLLGGIGIVAGRRRRRVTNRHLASG